MRSLIGCWCRLTVQKFCSGTWGVRVGLVCAWSELGSMMWIPSIAGFLTSVQWFPVPGRNIVLVNPFESEQQRDSVKESACLCVCAARKWWSGGGDRCKQDANEPVLINVCLISYSALSGHRKDRGGEQREQWESVGRSSWESAGPTSDSLPSLRTLFLRNCLVNADSLSLRQQDHLMCCWVSEWAELLLHLCGNNLIICRV